MIKKEITAIIQARIGSSRYRGKVLKKIRSKEIILLQILRLKKCKNIKKIIVAIPNNKDNLILKNFLISHTIDFFTGSENNVLKRYYDCSVKNNVKHILRITADCPLIDPYLIDQLALKYSSTKKLDYLSNIIERSYPVGMDAEFFSFKALKDAFRNAIYKDDKEHVTKYFLRSDKFIKKNISFKDDYSKLRLTLDYKEDFKLINRVFKNFTNIYFSLNDIIKFYKNNISLFKNHQNKINKKKWNSLPSTEKLIINKWKELSKKYNLRIKIYRTPLLCTFVFDGIKHEIYKDLITQELLKKGILETNTIYLSKTHTKSVLKKYFFYLNKVFGLISRCEKGDDTYRYFNSSLLIKEINKFS